ncbi:MAG: type secretion system protein [Proteobacteria bacterium]|nr:type secretion system protein [Pseudomonadota bacterium]
MLERPEALLRAFASAFTQHTRLLTLAFGGEGWRPDMLLPHTLSGQAALSTLYRYELDCLSSDAHLELKDLLGLPVQVGLLTPTGDERVITGLVTAAQGIGSNGGFASYRLVIEPALALLAQRRCSRVFQDMNIVEIIKTVLDEHAANNPAIAAAFAFDPQLETDYSARSYCLQYRESDLEFIQRLLREEGISYRFAFRSGDTPLHTLILFDDPYALDESPLGRIRFHRADGTEHEDTLQGWEGQRRIMPPRVSLASFDYKTVATEQSQDATTQDQGAGGEQAGRSLEDYDPQGPYYGGLNELSRYARLRQQAHDRAAKSFTARGTVRALNVGEWFTLSGHPVHDQDPPEQRQFVVTGETLAAENNLPGELIAGLSGLLAADPSSGNPRSKPPFQNQLTLIRRGIALTPDFAHTEHAKPKANGVQTATVVGPAGEEIHTDELGRIKIQFHWQRPSEHPEFGANFDDRSSCWLRVAYPSAGAGWGQQFIPRIGQEVLVDFIEGDIDRPIIKGALYNGTHTPPKFSGAGSMPANKTLSGIKSKEYKGSQYNELLFDDTTNEVRAKLSSEHAKTQFNLGYLAHPRSESKAEPRGEGAELRTDAAAVIRAAQGILLSTDARSDASDSQLARSELINHLQTALDLLKGLGDSAETCHAFKTETNTQNELNQQLADWENGSNTAQGKANGQSPIIALSSPGGISSATPKTSTHYAGEQLNQIAGQHLQQTAGEQITLNAGQGISLFSQKEGVRLIAHEGQFLAQAQTDDIAINAQKDVKITSSTEAIDLAAAKNITFITSGGAYLKIADGKVEVGCPGAFTVKAGGHSWEGPASQRGALPVMPSAEFINKHSLRFAFEHADAMAEDAGMVGKPFTITDDMGQILESGTVPQSGVLPRVMLDEAKQLTLSLGQSGWEVVELPLSNDEMEEADSDEMTGDETGFDDQDEVDLFEHDPDAFLPRDILDEMNLSSVEEKE